MPSTSPTRRVLLLCSYCNGSDGVECTDDLPCLECLMTCAIVTIPRDTVIEDNLESWAYNQSIAATGMARKCAENLLRDQSLEPEDARQWWRDHGVATSPYTPTPADDRKMSGWGIALVILAIVLALCMVVWTVLS